MKHLLQTLLLMFMITSCIPEAEECTSELAQDDQCTTNSLEESADNTEAENDGISKKLFCSPNSIVQKDCSEQIENAIVASISNICNDEGSDYLSLGECQLESCTQGYVRSNNECLKSICVANQVQSINCTNQIANARSASFNQACNSQGTGVVSQGQCLVNSCIDGFMAEGNTCVPSYSCTPNSTQSIECVAQNASSAMMTNQCKSDGSGYNQGACIISSCNSGYKLENNICVQVNVDNPNDQGGLYVNLDFEDGSDGEYAIGADALNQRAGQATYSSNYSYTGTSSLKAEVQEGRTPFGGRITLGRNLSEGDEIWYRARWFFPMGWQFTSGSGMKLMRIGLVSKENRSRGYWDIYIDNPTLRIEPHTDLGVAKKGFNAYKYNESSLIVGSHGQHGEVVKMDTWNTYEIYVKFSAQSENSIIRIWQEGLLVFECKGVVPTLSESTDKSNFVLIGNYFNGTGPKTQSAYVDDVTITSQRPEHKDSSGNFFLGL